MKPTIERLNISILEDSDFYNRILSTRLQNFTNELSIYHGFTFQLESYAHTDDFMRNLRPETDIAFVDYYLGNGITGLDLVQKIKQRCTHCKVVILSQSRRVGVRIRGVANDMVEFIFKDQYAIPRTCFIVEEIAHERFNKPRFN